MINGEKYKIKWPPDSNFELQLQTWDLQAQSLSLKQSCSKIKLCSTKLCGKDDLFH